MQNGIVIINDTEIASKRFILWTESRFLFVLPGTFSLSLSLPLSRSLILFVSLFHRCRRDRRENLAVSLGRRRETDLREKGFVLMAVDERS